MVNTPEIGLRWVDQILNPFSIRYLDVRPFTRTRHAFTADRSIAERFLELRNSTGKEHCDQEPRNAIKVDCHLVYPIDFVPPEGPAATAGEMDDKWDIFFYNEVLYFTRSWGGELVYKAEVSFTLPKLIIQSIEADAEFCGADPQLATAQVDFLVKSHIFCQLVPLPIPQEIPNDKTQIAMFSFNTYGRQASFATYENTLSIGSLEECSKSLIPLRTVIVNCVPERGLIIAENVSKEIPLEIVGQSVDVVEGAELVRENRPDLLMTCISLKKLSGIELISTVRSFDSNVRIVVTTIQSDREALALEAGANAFVALPPAEWELPWAVRDAFESVM